eukprot:7560107-Pyramimonas_sp.AAC.1
MAECTREEPVGGDRGTPAHGNPQRHFGAMRHCNTAQRTMMRDGGFHAWSPKIRRCKKYTAQHHDESPGPCFPRRSSSRIDL